MVSFAQRFQSKAANLAKRIPWKPVLILVTAAFFLSWLSLTPDGLLGKADAVGYAVCHRIDLRSFHLGERQLSVCARCTGQYLGAVLGLAYLWTFRSRRIGSPPWVIIGILGSFAFVYAVDGLNSYLHLIPSLSRFYIYEPHNTLRLITGSGLGLGMSVMVFPAFNQTMWKNGDSRPVLSGFRDFGGLILLTIFLNLLVLSENPLILYPLSLISAVGILVLLTMIYTMVLSLVFGVENRFHQFRQMVYPILGGFLLAIIQIVALDSLRYLLTKTWGEFPIG
jgi:uncharacterized membrane protein